MWDENVNLYIDDTSIRLLVNQGQRIKKWADLQLEPGLVKSSMVTEEGEVASRIKQLLQSQRVKTRKVSLGFSGLHSLTRPATLPQLPKAMLAEAVAREARRVLPMPLDQLYLTWRTIPCPKGRIQVFIAATPRKTADSLIHTLHSAGLTPSRMTIKSLILTKTLPVNTAILVDVQPAEYDIIIVSDGIPQPIRTITFSNEELSWEQKLITITGDLDRTIKFFDTNNPEKPLNPSVPVFVSGELVNKPELHKTLSEKTGRAIQTLTPNLKGPEQIDIGRYGVNIAMAMKASNYLKDPSFAVANLNLIPAPYQPKPISLTKVMGIPGGVAVASLIIPMVMMIQSGSSSITAKQNELEMTNQVINQKTAQRLELKKSVTELQAKATVVQKAYDKLNNSSEALSAQHEYINGDLAIVLGRLMPSISLDNISISGNIITLTGTAPNQQDIYTYSQTILQYARSLDVSGRYVKTTISSLKAVTNSKSSTQPGQGNQTTGDSQETANTDLNQPTDKIAFVLNIERKGK